MVAYFRGAQEENRTPDLRITSALLYQLSYLGAGSNASEGRSRSSDCNNNSSFGLRSNASSV